MAFGGDLGLALLELGESFRDHLGMLHQILLDDGLDLAALRVGKALGAGRERRKDERGRDQGGAERTDREHEGGPFGWEFSWGRTSAP